MTTAKKYALIATLAMVAISNVAQANLYAMGSNGEGAGLFSSILGAVCFFTIVIGLSELKEPDGSPYTKILLGIAGFFAIAFLGFWIEIIGLVVVICYWIYKKFFDPKTNQK